MLLFADNPLLGKVMNPLPKSMDPFEVLLKLRLTFDMLLTLLNVAQLLLTSNGTTNEETRGARNSRRVPDVSGKGAGGGLDGV
jgi:hypothetical protein